MAPILINLVGIVAILLIAFLLSTGKKRISLRVVGATFALQALMALLVLRTPWGVQLIQALSNGVIALLDYSKVGIEAIFGPMGANPFTNTFVIAALLNRKVDVTVGALSNVAHPADAMSQRFLLLDSSRSIDTWGKTRELLSGEPSNEKVALPLRKPVSRINHQPGGRD